MKRTSIQFVAAFLLSFAVLFCHGCRYGYYGTDPQCTPCPINTYKDFVGNAQACTPCPLKSGHSNLGSNSLSDCQCSAGYNGAPQHGVPCVIRSCEFLITPLNGAVVGTCNRQYLSVCRFQCNEGYEGIGSKERQCSIMPHHNVMEWSGSSLQCQQIWCPVLVVQNAEPPSGVCTTRLLVYQTRCIYQCRAGYRLIGSKEHVCQLDKTWSGGSTVCERITCPPLQPVQFARYSPAECSTVPTPAFRVCQVLCHDGFQIRGSNYLDRLNLICQLDGSWDNQSPLCIDFRSPELVCPNNMYVDTAKGSAFAEVLWSVDVSDNSFAVDPNAKVIVRSNYQPPYKFPIGSHYVNVNATDKEGNVARCGFKVNVRDTEPPTCSACPSDILLEVQGSNERVNWDLPHCTDNSGLLVTIQSNYHRGAFFSVPGTYHVQFTVKDADDNIYKGCSFMIKLKKKTCPLYAPPKNGALTCIDTGGDLSCVAMCKDGYDFVFNPPMFYFCSSGEWNYFALPQQLYKRSAPWPNCSKAANPSWLRQAKVPGFFFNGDANDPNVQDTLRENFIVVLRSPYIPPFFCTFNPKCTKDNVLVYPGKVV